MEISLFVAYSMLSKGESQMVKNEYGELECGPSAMQTIQHTPQTVQHHPAQPQTDHFGRPLLPPTQGTSRSYQLKFHSK